MVDPGSGRGGLWLAAMVGLLTAIGAGVLYVSERTPPTFATSFAFTGIVLSATAAAVATAAGQRGGRIRPPRSEAVPPPSSPYAADRHRPPYVTYTEPVSVSPATSMGPL